MSSTLDNLVRMANQIAANLQHEPDVAAAVAEHIHLFWDPRMKQMIHAHDGAGLSADALAAINLLKTRA
ncbi:MAG: formate dehydrogenase subunit delta [Chakrabartia sp.]